MGIQDREYYRSEGPSFLGGFSERGQVCKWLIIINVCVFLAQLVIDHRPQVGPSPLTDALALSKDAVLHGQVWRLVTYAFLHSTGSLWHILFNMLFLWWFGSRVEEIYGPREFLAFYLTAAVLGALAYIGWQVVDGSNAVAIGASGAVLAATVVFACHYPHHKILLFFILPVPIWAMAVLLVAQDAFGLLGGSRAQTAFACHLGGAAFGFLYFRYQWRLLDLWTSLRGSTERRRANPHLRLYREEPEMSRVPPVPAAVGVDEQLEAKLDAVLAKVSATGKESLTDDERDILLRASEIYKKRRT